MPSKKRKRNKRVSSFVNNQFDFTLCITVLVLLAMGIIMVLLHSISVRWVDIVIIVMSVRNKDGSLWRGTDQ